MDINLGSRHVGKREERSAEYFSLIGTLRYYEVEEISALQAAKMLAEVRNLTGARGSFGSRHSST